MLWIEDVSLICFQRQIAEVEKVKKNEITEFDIYCYDVTL